MKIVMVVGKVRWPYLIDVLHYKYKVTTGKMVLASGVSHQGTRLCNTNKCLSNIIFAVVI